MLRIVFVIGLLGILMGCDDDGPYFVDPDPGEVPTADYRAPSPDNSGLPPDVKAHGLSSRGSFVLPTLPTTQVCSTLNGGVVAPQHSIYWGSCKEAPVWIVESTVESILRDLGVFWSSIFVPCDCSDIDPDCSMNAFASSSAPGFIWYDDALVNAMTFGESLIPVAYLMAHEAAHHIQFEHGHRHRTNKSMELGADCMAGYFLGFLTCTGQVDGIDVNAALNEICLAGDLPGTPWWDENAHGSCAERVAAALFGISGYALRIEPRIMCVGEGLKRGDVMAGDKRAHTPDRTVEVVDSAYQPSKAELEEDVSINATPDEVARSLTRTVRTRRVKSPSKRAATGQREKPPGRG